jgi:CBS domain-containing protein
MVTVDEIMTTSLATLPVTATLADAIRLMAEKNIRHMPVLDDDGKLAGLATQRDVLAATDSTLRGKEERVSPADIPLAHVMTKKVVTVDIHTSLLGAARYLQQHKYGCLPVVSEGKLKGIVTDSDFVAVAINLLEQVDEAEQPEDYLVT